MNPCSLLGDGSRGLHLLPGARQLAWVRPHLLGAGAVEAQPDTMLVVLVNSLTPRALRTSRAAVCERKCRCARGRCVLCSARLLSRCVWCAFIGSRLLGRHIISLLP